MFTPTSKEELHDAILSYMNGDKSNGYIHHWDVSQITDMSNLFSDIPMFNEPISHWNVSNVTTMANMFYGCTSFNQDLSSWDVSQVTDMSRMFYQCKNFTGLSHHKKWRCISAWDTRNVINMTRMLEDAILFIAKIHVWDVSHVVYCKDFNKNCCHMRRNLPSFSKEATHLELIVPLHDFYESPIIDSAKQMTPLTYEPSISPLRFSPPHQLIRSTNTIINANHEPSPVKIPSPEVNLGTRRQSPIQSPEVEFLGTRRQSPIQSPEVEFLGTRRQSQIQSPEVEFLGVRRPVSPQQSPEVEYLGTRRPGEWTMPNFFKRTGGTRKKNKKKKRKSITHR